MNKSHIVPVNDDIVHFDSNCKCKPGIDKNVVVHNFVGRGREVLAFVPGRVMASSGVDDGD